MKKAAWMQARLVKLRSSLSRPLIPSSPFLSLSSVSFVRKPIVALQLLKTTMPRHLQTDDFVKGGRMYASVQGPPFATAPKGERNDYATSASVILNPQKVCDKCMHSPIVDPRCASGLFTHCNAQKTIPNKQNSNQPKTFYKPTVQRVTATARTYTDAHKHEVCCDRKCVKIEGICSSSVVSLPVCIHLHIQKPFRCLHHRRRSWKNKRSRPLGDCYRVSPTASLVEQCASGVQCLYLPLQRRVCLTVLYARCSFVFNRRHPDRHLLADWPFAGDFARNRNQADRRRSSSSSQWWRWRCARGALVAHSGLGEAQQLGRQARAHDL